MQQPYADVPASLMPPRPPPHYQPQGVVLQLRGDNGNKTISMADPNGYLLYRYFETHRSTASSKPDYVVAHAPSGAAVGSIRYHRFTGTGLDYWEVGGRKGGAGFFAWRLESADERLGRWKCYRAIDLERLGKAAAPVVATAEYDWKAGEEGKPDGAVGMCELFDVRLLDRERSAEMVELYITAIMVIGSAANVVAKMKMLGKIGDVVEITDTLSSLAEAGGDGGADGGGADGGDGGGGAAG